MTVKSNMESIFETTERNLYFYLPFMIAPFFKLSFFKSLKSKEFSSMGRKSSERQAKMRRISELHRNYRTNF